MQFLNDKSIPLQILYSSSVWWKITPLYSNNIFFAQKEHIKMEIFETFKCSGQNSSNSSCQFWNDKSIPFQILHHSSLSWYITPIQISSSCIFFPSKLQFWDFGVLWWRFAISLMPLSKPKTQVSSPSNFTSLFNVIKDKSSILF